MLISRKLLLRILGLLWLLDGVLQLQPQMFTMNMVNSVMVPAAQGQPQPIAAILTWIVSTTTAHLTLVNLTIALVQILLGLGLMFCAGERLKGTWVKYIVIASLFWALIVWFGGEGMSMLLTGQASILTGAPGAVLLYPLLGLVAYPAKDGEETVISRAHLRWILAGFWLCAALLQLQPYWWQESQISNTIGSMVGQGGLNSVLVDPVLQPLSTLTAASEIPLNIALIVVFLGLGLALVLVRQEALRPALIASICVSLLIWYAAQGFGMIFTGMATDFNSGLLLVVIALACIPKKPALRLMSNRPSLPRQQNSARQERSPVRSV